MQYEIWKRIICLSLYIILLSDAEGTTSSIASWRDSRKISIPDTDDNDGSQESQIQIQDPRAVILSPEGDEAMLSEGGALSITIQVFGWLSGVMTVHVNETMVAETAEGYLSDVNDPPQEFNFELYGPRAYGTYCTRVAFYTHYGGTVWFTLCDSWSSD